MEIVQKLKNMNLNIIWNDEDDGILGKSMPIVRAPFKFEEQLLIMEGDDDVYFKFSCDENSDFWVPVLNIPNFLHLFDIYTRRYYAEEEIPKSMSNKVVYPPHKNTIYYYGGMCSNVDNLETKMCFNKYLCKTNKNYKTAFWLSEQPVDKSVYRTMFSDSVISFELLTKFTVQIKTTDDSKKFHPLFIKINYPTANHMEIKNDTMGDCMLYDVLYKDMPYDIWAALHKENVLDIEKIVEMLNGMDDELDTEIEYLNFVLAVLNELNTSP